MAAMPPGDYRQLAIVLGDVGIATVDGRDALAGQDLAWWTVRRDALLVEQDEPVAP